MGSVKDLYNEVEREQTNLELWGRHDGVPLLVRVVHVLQLKVCSTDPRLAGKFLLQKAAKTAVQEQLSYLADAHFQFDPDTCVDPDQQTKSGVVPRQVSFVGHRHEVEESPSF